MNVLGYLRDFLYPPECHICGCRLCEHERCVCTPCLTDLARTGYHRNPLNPMTERLAGHFPFDFATAHFFYSRNSPFSSLIQDMKYRQFPDIGTLLGATAGKELFATGFFSDVDVIVPVPMHFLKKARRGYNQVDYIARGLSMATDIPVSDALKAVRTHRTQTSLSKEERRDNLKDIFTVKEQSAVEGKGVLLVDDICTTGATLSAAGDAIHSALPRSLSLFTLGITF